MRFGFVLAIAAATVGVTNAICFDNFDCIGRGFNCVRQKGKLLGQCAPKAVKRDYETTEELANALPAVLKGRSITEAIGVEMASIDLAPRDADPEPSPEEIMTDILAIRSAAGICFDSFDCIGRGFNCVKKPKKFLGTCEAPAGNSTRKAW